MASAAKGMKTQLTRGSGGARAGKGVVAAMRSQADAPPALIPVLDLQPNPDNPPDRSVPSESMVASVREVGVITEVTAVTREDWLRTHPEHETSLTTQPYVVLAGHRRRAAALEVGLDVVPGRVRRDLDDLALETIYVHENVHRAELTPLEEAAAYARIMERHRLSQRQLAKHTGVSQSQISKKLRLLTLPPQTRDAAATGAVPVEVALTLLEEDAAVAALVDEAVGAAADDPTAALTAARFGDLITSARREARAQAVETKARQQAEERHAEYVPEDAVAARVGGDPERHRLSSDDAISAAQRDGTLLVAPRAPSAYSGGGVEFFTTETPAPSPEKPAETGSSRAVVERRSASRRRRDALLATVASGLPSVDGARGDVLRWALGHVSETAPPRRPDLDLAAPLLAAAGLVPEDTDAGAVHTHLAALTQRQQWSAVWVVLLATREAHLGAPPWGSEALEHYEWLVSQGYEPGEWEQEQLDAAARTIGGSHD